MMQPPYRPRRARGGLAGGLLAVALAGALIGLAADRYASADQPVWPAGSALPSILTSIPRLGLVAAADATPSPTGQLSSDPAERAIQEVIRTGDDEQARAVATRDLSALAATATADFYTEQARATQDLLDHGVTGITLLDIEWGPITIDGTIATATAWETWSTTYSDGTTDRSRDRNVYTLVQDNGTWRVQSDAHPDDSAGGPPPANPAPGQPGPGPDPGPQPPTPGDRDTSENWSGYAAEGGTFTAVSGTWTVPQFSPDSPAGADATWVGIGGVSSRDLIQAGTEQTVSGAGATRYQTWVETLPRASHPVPLTISPGDSVTISIAQQPDAEDSWLVSFKNNTTGQSYQLTEHYTSSRSSAEWIEEAPSSMRGRLLALDNFGQVAFSSASAVKDGSQVSIADAGGAPVTMVTRGGQALAEPSPLGADGASFSVSRTATPAPVPGRRGAGNRSGQPTQAASDGPARP